MESLFMRTNHSRGGKVALCYFLLAGTSLWPAIDDARAVRRESHEEQEANLKQQSSGGLFNKWTFDQEQLGETPAGFIRVPGEGQQATWTIQQNTSAPSPPNIVAASSHCTGVCYQLLLATGFDYEYPDVTVYLRASNGSSAVGGVVFGVKDVANFYAAVVDLDGLGAQVIRMVEGMETVLGQAPVKLKSVDWHSLRVQRNTIISKDFIELFVDGSLLLSVEDQALGAGQVGLLVRENSSLLFDSFHAVPLFSHRPLSSPAAY